MRGLILTEGGRSIGYGHVTRSLSIYQALKEAGIKVKLIVNGDSSVMSLLNGVSYEMLDWLRGEDVLKEFSKTFSSFIFIDSYIAPYEFYEKASAIFCLKIFVDDFNRLKYPEGTILNGSIYANTIKYNSKNRLLLGPKYTPLRKPFWVVGEKPINDRVERILITFGGTDTTKVITERVVELLAHEYPELEKVIIMGEGNNGKGTEDLKRLYGPYIEIFISPDAEKIKELMYNSDIAISGGGQTLYELARVGVPTIGVCLAKNQEMNLVYWEKSGFVKFAGWYHDKQLIDRIAENICELADRGKRLESSLIGRRFVDGLGGSRIVTVLKEHLQDGLTFIDVVKLNDELIELIRKWRNSEHVRKNMLTKRYITVEEHRKFVETLKNEREKRRMWMFFYSGKPVGVVTLFDIDYIQRKANWGVYIGDKGFLRRGLGKKAVMFILKMAFEEFGLDFLYTKVLRNNEPAIKLYEKLGFERITDAVDLRKQEEVVTYILHRKRWVKLLPFR